MALDQSQVLVETQKEPYQLKELSQRHREVAALLAQGVKREMVAAACEISPEYVTWLARQPLFKAYVQEMNNYVGLRMEAMFEQSVDVIAETMTSGNAEERLKAAKLQLEATGRVGRYQSDAPPGGGTQLDALAERLVSLLTRQRQRTFEGVVTDAKVEVVS